MSTTLLEMAQQIVSAHAQNTPMTTDELIREIQRVYATLQALETGAPTETASPEASAEALTGPQLTVKQAFKKDEVICMVCGKGGMKALTRHLSQVHQMKPTQYRKQFGILKSQPLMSKSYAAKRKEIAAGMDLTGNLEKARAARQGNTAAVNKSNLPAVKHKAPVPAKRVKAAVPAVRKKAGVPVKVDKT
jgi:predicted transcriptional regulator